jgi:hypothetical protein
VVDDDEMKPTLINQPPIKVSAPEAIADRPRSDSIPAPEPIRQTPARNTPPTIDPPNRPSKPSLRDAAPAFDPTFMNSTGKLPELPTTPLPVASPPRSGTFLTVVLVLLVAGVAGTAVYFLLPLLT